MTERAKKFKIRSYELNTVDDEPNAKTAYASFIKCPYCGSYYQSKVNHYNGKATRFMMCASNKDKKLCESEAYKVQELNKILAKLISTLKEDKDNFKKFLYSSFRLADEDSIKNKINELTNEINSLSLKYRANQNSGNKFLMMASNNYLEKAIKLAEEKNILVMTIASSMNTDRKIKNYINILENLPTDEEDIESSYFKELFSNAVIVNQNLIYFIVGGQASHISKEQKFLYESEHEYIIRKTTFKTKYGIIISK